MKHFPDPLGSPENVLKPKISYKDEVVSCLDDVIQENMVKLIITKIVFKIWSPK